MSTETQTQEPIDYKTDALTICPGLVCSRVQYPEKQGRVTYEVREQDTGLVLGTAEEDRDKAWRDALTEVRWLRALVQAYDHERIQGRAWEPRHPYHPYFDWAIERGYMERKDGRFLFERIKDSFIDFTDLGRQRVAEWRPRLVETALDASPDKKG